MCAALLIQKRQLRICRTLFREDRLSGNFYSMSGYIHEGGYKEVLINKLDNVFEENHADNSVFLQSLANQLLSNS